MLVLELPFETEHDKIEFFVCSSLLSKRYGKPVPKSVKLSTLQYQYQERKAFSLLF